MTCVEQFFNFNFKKHPSIPQLWKLNSTATQIWNFLLRGNCIFYFYFLLHHFIALLRKTAPLVEFSSSFLFIFSHSVTSQLIPSKSPAKQNLFYLHTDTHSHIHIHKLTYTYIHTCTKNTHKPTNAIFSYS